MTHLTAKVIRELLIYEADTGKFIWRERPASLFEDSARGNASARSKIWNTRYAGTPALNTIDSMGYRVGYIFARQVKAHRAAWVYVYGEWPDKFIDHVNGVRDDNRIENLRAVDATGNSRNQRRARHNKSGITGVYWHKKQERWCAVIYADSKPIHLGSFMDMSDAIVARSDAAKILGFHENHGRVA